jgi:glycosyltransferase involved in cell wall biosynthesis
MNLIRLLTVSYTFPPDEAVGGLRLARFCRYLPEYGIQPIVLSVDDRFYEGLDYSVELPEHLQVVRTGSMSTPIDWYRRIRQHLAPGAKNKNSHAHGADSSFMRRQLLALMQFPDRYWGWYFQAVKAADTLIKQEKIDAILSSGPPWISHLVGRRLKAKHHLPWLADFRDPWSHLLPEKSGPLWSQHLSGSLEDRCIESADLVICNTDRLRRAYQGHYGRLNASKFRTLTNGFEDYEIEMNPPPASDKRVFLHLGSIYGLRRIDTFLQAIADLTHSGRLNPNTFRLVFQGSVSPDFIVAAEKSCPDLLRNGCLEFRPRISWKDSRRELASADRLLLFQGNHELQVPAKFYEYLQTGIPIFAVTEEGALSDLLSATRSGAWASPNNPSQIAERFLDFLQVSRRSPESIKKDLNNQFHYRHLTSQLSDWVHGLLGHVEHSTPEVSSVAL